VTGQSYEYAGLSDLVAVYPPSVVHAKAAESHTTISKAKAFISTGMLGAAAAAFGVGLAGYARNDHRLEIGGAVGTVVFLPLGWAFAASASNSLKEATTEAMNAVDIYNDDYIHGEAAK
jgi:hypothetical protein